MTTLLPTERPAEVDPSEAPTLDSTGAADRAWVELLARLNRLSLDKHFDAYTDIAWDDPAFQIDPEDPRWELAEDSPLGRTSWYRSQPAGIRARIGLHDITMKMKIGLEFESILKRGLLEYAATLPNGAPEFRYAYHELIEEAQHSLMFQEFVNRSGLAAPGMPADVRLAARRVPALGRRFPELFFLFVLGGEDPIDHVQRKVLAARRAGTELHPLVERVMRIHVTEEARHLSFARHYLRRNVPKLGVVKRAGLAIGAPVILGAMAQMMMRPSPIVAKTYGIPREVLREAYGSEDARAEVRASLRKLRNLCTELHITRQPFQQLWKAFGIWDPPDPR